MSLRACTSCQRLVRVQDARCPFCATAVAPTPLPGGTPLVRRARAALLVSAIGASALGATACEKEASGPPPQVAPQPAPMPTGPEADAGASVAPQPSPGMPVAMYGAAPPPTK